MWPIATWRRMALGRSWTRDHLRMKETVASPPAARSAAALYETLAAHERGAGNNAPQHVDVVVGAGGVLGERSDCVSGKLEAFRVVWVELDGLFGPLASERRVAADDGFCRPGTPPWQESARRRRQQSLRINQFGGSATKRPVACAGHARPVSRFVRRSLAGLVVRGFFAVLREVLPGSPYSRTRPRRRRRDGPGRPTSPDRRLPRGCLSPSPPGRLLVVVRSSLRSVPRDLASRPGGVFLSKTLSPINPLSPVNASHSRLPAIGCRYLVRDPTGSDQW